MFNFIALYASFLGWSLLGAPLITNRYQSLFWSVCAITSVLYCFGLIDALLVGVWSIFLVGVASLFYVLFRVAQEKAFRSQLIPSLVHATILFLSWLFIDSLTAGKFVFCWDEFAHWGFHVKDMLLTDALPTKGTPLLSPDYYPGPTMLRYYVAKILNNGEGDYYFANMLFLFSGYLALADGGKGKWRLVAAIMVVVTAYFVAWIFFDELIMETLLVESLLGIALAVALVMVHEDEELSLLKYAPIIITITMLKQIGIILSLMVIASMVTKSAVRKKSASLKHYKTEAGLLTVAICAFVSWHVHMARNGFSPIIKADFSVFLSAMRGDFLAAISGLFERITTIITSPYPEFFGKTAKVFSLLNWIDVSMYIVLIVLIILMAINVVLSKKDEVKILALANIILLCGYAVLLGMLAMLWFVAPIFSGVGAFARYLSPVGFTILIFTVVTFLNKFKMRYRIYINCAILVCLLPLVPMKAFSSLDAHEHKIRDARVKSIQLASSTRQALNDVSKVYYVHQNSTGEPYYMFRMDVAPIATQPMWTGMKGDGKRPTYLWSLGKPYHRGDIWTTECSANEFAELLKNYDGVVIGNADAKFWNQYGSIFSDQYHVIYKVVILDDGSVNCLGVGNKE